MKKEVKKPSKKRASVKTPAKTAKVKGTKKETKKPSKKTGNLIRIKKATVKPTEKTTIKVNDNVAIEIVVVPLKKHRDKNGGHYHVIIEDMDDKHVSVGFTTEKKKGNSKKAGKNYSLEKSPLNDGKHSYMRRQGTVDGKTNYYSPRTGTMTRKDYDQAKSYGERAKQKYLKEKERKKSNDSAKTRKGNKP